MSYVLGKSSLRTSEKLVKTGNILDAKRWPNSTVGTKVTHTVAYRFSTENTERPGFLSPNTVYSKIIRFYMKFSILKDFLN